MNRKSVVVSTFDKEYMIECFIDSNKQYTFMTDNPLAIGFVTQVFLTRDYTSEELMETLAADIL